MTHCPVICCASLSFYSRATDRALYGLFNTGKVLEYCLFSYHVSDLEGLNHIEVVQDQFFHRWVLVNLLLDHLFCAVLSQPEEICQCDIGVHHARWLGTDLCHYLSLANSPGVIKKNLAIMRKMGLYACNSTTFLVQIEN